MSALSDYLERDLINAVFRNTQFTSSASVYLAVFNTNPGEDDSGLEVTGSGYERQVVAWDAPVDGVTHNTNAEVFSASADWGNVTHWAVYDQYTGGNLLIYATLEEQRIVSGGDSLTFAAGALTCSFL